MTTQSVTQKPGGDGGEPRIGVYVCHCGLNIAQSVNCRQVAATAADADGVDVVSRVLIGTGLVLFLITFVVNFIARKLTEKASA